MTKAQPGNRSRRVVLITLASAALIGGLFSLRDRIIPRDEEPANVRASPRELPPAPRKDAPAEITLLPMAVEASAALAATGGTVEDDLSTIELLLSSYGRQYDGQPTGENEEIAAALLGKNSKRVAYLEDRGPYLDKSRRLIDRWGTPYFFHTLTATRTEIRSAGPDHEIFTDDDLVRPAGGD